MMVLMTVTPALAQQENPPLVNGVPAPKIPPGGTVETPGPVFAGPPEGEVEKTTTSGPSIAVGPVVEEKLGGKVEAGQELPKTGGGADVSSLVSLGAGVLLVASGLLAYRIVR